MFKRLYAEADSLMSASKEVGLGKTLLGGGLLVLTVFIGLEFILPRNRILTAMLTLLYAPLAWQGVKFAASPEIKKAPLHRGLSIAVIWTLIAAITCGALSMTLIQFHLARYSKSSDSLTYFVGYYLWVLLDSIPALRIPNTLQLSAPLAPQNFYAGLPVLFFRSFVLLNLLKVLKTWWAGRSASPAEAVAASNS